MDGDIANDSRTAVRLAFAGFELRFHEGNDLSGGPQQVDGGREQFLQRNERTVHDCGVNRYEWLWKALQRQVSGVDAFHDHNPGVMAKSPGQLAVSNVHGIDFGSAVLEQAIGETAG